MKIIDFDKKRQAKDNGLHDSIIDAFSEIKKTLEENEEKAEAMVCFIKGNQGQYYNSVIMQYSDIVEMIGLIDVMKLALADSIGD